MPAVLPLPVFLERTLPQHSPFEKSWKLQPLIITWLVAIIAQASILFLALTPVVLMNAPAVGVVEALHAPFFSVWPPSPPAFFAFVLMTDIMLLLGMLGLNGVLKHRQAGVSGRQP